MEEYQDLIMRLYWDCQDLVTSLGEEGVTDRKKVIIKWLENTDSKYPKLPEFKSEYHWLNVEKPLTMERLGGLVTLFDFFTYCCINCMHILPDLEALEKKYDGAKFSIVGIHSAKFENEKEDDHLADAVARYGIRHPVCNDTGAWLWSCLGVTCWPTQLLLGPHGRPLWVSMGEGQAGWVEEVAAAMMEFYGDRGMLTGEQVVSVESARVKGRFLSYPGKLTVSEDLVVISDTGNNRLVITDREGRLVDTVGSGEPGECDGDFASARFRHPQGVVRVDRRLYVCDTDNNKVRCCDLDTRRVESMGGAPGLSSPWDLVHLRLPDSKGECLLVAMAGCHQIWLCPLTDVIWWKGAKHFKGSWISVVGSGKEENRNNSYPTKAGLAQPSGLCTDSASWLYFADSESSSVRRISIKDGAVTNVAGGDRDPLNLFSYGDTEGDGISAKLQHPLGVALDPRSNLLYIADSYNHKIKRAELKGKLFNVTSVIAGLSEPGGLSHDPVTNSLFIADTNSHCIKILNIEDNSLTSFNITSTIPDVVDSPAKREDSITSEHQIHSDCGKVEVIASLGLSTGTKLNTEAKSMWKLTSDGGAFNTLTGWIQGDEVTIDLAGLPLIPGDTHNLTLTGKLYLCSDQGHCSATSFRRVLKFNIVEDTNSEIKSINIGTLL